MTEEYAEAAGEEQQDLDAQLDQQQDGGGDAAPSAEDLKREQAELEAMKARLKAMEEEVKAKEAQGKVEGKEGDAAAEAADREEVDGRSIYVGNVDYSCTPEELQLHFQGCGTVNRVTILTDKFGNAKGFAYVEFLEVDAVQSATLLDGSELRGREVKVSPKRTNVPGLKAYRGGGGRFGGGRGRGRRGGRGYYGGYAPRGRGRGFRGGYSPY